MIKIAIQDREMLRNVKLVFLTINTVKKLVKFHLTYKPSNYPVMHSIMIQTQ